MANQTTDIRNLYLILFQTLPGEKKELARFQVNPDVTVGDIMSAESFLNKIARPGVIEFSIESKWIEPKEPTDEDYRNDDAEMDRISDKWR